MDTERKVVIGDRVKRLKGGKIGGYLVRFTNEDRPDLAGDFFTAETDFGGRKSLPLLFNHGMDKKLKNTILADVEVTQDEWGVWLEGVLSEREEYEKHILSLIDAGKLGLSSGAVGVPEWVPTGKAHWIKSWVLGEASLTHTPAEYSTLVVPLKSLVAQEDTATGEDSTEGEPEADMAAAEPEAQPEAPTKNTEPPEIMENQNQEPREAPVKDDRMDDVLKSIAALTARLEAKEEAEKARKNVEPEYSAPAIITDTDHFKYDNYDTSSLALVYETLSKSSDRRAKRPSDALVKALARRLDSSDPAASGGAHYRYAYKSWAEPRGIKANEIMYSTLSSYGDEWVGVAYSSDLWEKVRSATAIVSQIPSFEFPGGAESMVIPIESTDPTWYKVAQATSISANPGGIPTNTVTASQATTAQVSATLSKFGARVLYTGELNEDAMLPFVPVLQRQIVMSGAEYLESAVIDGDSETGATTNVNDIAGTPAATDWFLNFDGFRKNALVTNTANSRSGGALGTDDFLETAKLLGTAGQYAEPGRAAFIMDVNTHWKALELSEVKTKDVSSNPTIEGGRLRSIWGFDVYPSFHMHKAQASRKANTAGKIDLDTAGNNTTGSLLMVRWDHWMFGYRRRMQIESTRVPAADSTEIVAMFRASLVKRDTDASAITYNITV